MSQTYIKGPICGVDNCPSRLYRSIDGQRFCQYGHVLEGDLEVGDDDDNFTVTRRMQLQVNAGGQLIHKSKEMVKRRKQVQKLMGSPAKEAYLKCVQIILKSQLSAIVKELYGNNQDFLQQLEPMVKSNWVKYLHLFIKPYTIESTDTDRYGREVAKFNIKKNNRTPNVTDGLFVIFFSIRQLNWYPIYVSDLIDLIVTGRVALLRTLHLLPPKLLLQLPKSLTRGLEAEVFNGEIFRTYYSRVGKKMQYDNLQLSYFYPYMFKTFFETLLLPNSIELFIMVNNLSKLVDLQLPTPLIKKPKKTMPALLSHYTPDLMVTAFMIIVIKIHFIYLNNKIDYTQWFNNLSNINLDNDKFEFLNKFDNESIYNLVNWSEAKINNYCNYLNNLETKHRVQLREETYQGNVMVNRLMSIFNDDSLASDQHPIVEESNLNGYLKSYVNEHLGKASKRDIHIIEDLLFQKFSQIMMVPVQQMYAHYKEAEELIYKAVK